MNNGSSEDRPVVIEQLTVASFIPEDLQDMRGLLIELGQIAGAHYLQLTVDRVVFMIGRTDTTATFVAREEPTRRIIGFVAAVYERQWGGDYGYIQTLVVRSDRQMKGIGTRLLRAAHEWMPRNVRYIYLATTKPPTAACAFYVKNGYIHFSEASIMGWYPPR